MVSIYYPYAMGSTCLSVCVSLCVCRELGLVAPNLYISSTRAGGAPVPSWIKDMGLFSSSPRRERDSTGGSSVPSLRELPFLWIISHTWGEKEGRGRRGSHTTWAVVALSSGLYLKAIYKYSTGFLQYRPPPPLCLYSVLCTLYPVIPLSTVRTTPCKSFSFPSIPSSPKLPFQL